MTIIDSVIVFIARVLEVIFFCGAAGSTIVIVFTAIDIIRDISTLDVSARQEIDAIRRAA